MKHLPFTPGFRLYVPLKDHLEHMVEPEGTVGLLTLETQILNSSPWVLETITKNGPITE